MKLKGWKKLQKTIDKLGKQIAPELTFMLSGCDSSEPVDGVVYFGILRTLNDDKVFMDNLYATYPDAPIMPAYMYALLHEIGHNYTKEALDGESYALRKSIIADGDNERYFRLPSEKAATEWAIEYAKKNLAFLSLLGGQIESAVNHFIQKNETE